MQRVDEEEFSVAPVIIGMDPHERSATIEIIDGGENVLPQGRYGTDTNGYRATLATAFSRSLRVASTVESARRGDGTGSVQR